MNTKRNKRPQPKTIAKHIKKAKPEVVVIKSDIYNMNYESSKVPLSIQFKNRSNKKLPITIFDAAHCVNSAYSVNYGNDSQVEISIVDGCHDYLQMLYKAILTPRIIQRIDIEGCTSSTVVNNAISITEYEDDGKKITETYTPAINKFQQQNQCRTLDVSFVLDPFTAIKTTVNPNSTLIYRFYTSEFCESFYQKMLGEMRRRISEQKKINVPSTHGVPIIGPPTKNHAKKTTAKKK
jgi:hypothetical protein